MLSIEGISKSFGGVDALQDVGFDCGSGEILGLIGPNGAGKSTLVNVISGVLDPDRGTISLGGEVVSGRGAAHAARVGIARTFQNLRLFGDMTARQNVEVAHISCTRYRPDQAAAIDIDALLAEYGLSDDAERPAGSLPYGQQRRLEIVRALALGPRLLLFDEPAAGMNDYETAELAEAIRRIRARGDCALLVIDHDLHFILNLCDRICVMDLGKVATTGTPEAIRNDPIMAEIYLGQTN